MPSRPPSSLDPRSASGVSTLSPGLLWTMILAIVALVTAMIIAVLTVISDGSVHDDKSSALNASPEDIVRIYIRAVEAGDLATAKKVACDADIGGRTSIDSPWGHEVSMAVAGKSFEVNGQTVVPLKANGRAPSGLGGQELRDDDGGVAPLIRDGGDWKVCFKDFYADISGKESRGQGSQLTSAGDLSWA